MEFNDGRYASGDAVIKSFSRDRGHQRVGLAGPWDIVGVSPILPAFGPDLRNEVEYVGPFVDDLLLEYGDSNAFLQAVERGRYDILVVGKETQQTFCRYQGSGTDEHAWLRRAGYPPVLESERFTVYRVPETGRLQ